MKESNDWESLQEIWREDKRSAPPDVAAMIGAARRQRRMVMLILAAEWVLAAGALTLLVVRWADLAATQVGMLWWSFFIAVMAAVLAVTTWTRIGWLREPAGASLRDWLALRRRRARFGLRLARLTRFCVVALLPALLAVFVASDDRGDLSAMLAFGAPVVAFACAWYWGGRQAARLRAELAEVEAIEAEWLEDRPGPHDRA